jgi:Flp pilus assembly pilin Flp
MLSRFNLAPLFRAHWKGLTNGTNSPTPDWPSRLILIFIPVAVGILSVFFNWRLMAPAALLAGVTLLAGSLLSAFTHLSSLRMKISEWEEHNSDRFNAERAMLDETAAHLLLASLASIANAVIIVIGLNFRSGVKEEIDGFWAAMSLAFGSWTVILFVLCLPRLYSAYVEINHVEGYLSGFTRRRGGYK